MSCPNNTNNNETSQTHLCVMCINFQFCIYLFDNNVACCICKTTDIFAIPKCQFRSKNAPTFFERNASCFTVCLQAIVHFGATQTNLHLFGNVTRYMNGFGPIDRPLTCHCPLIRAIGQSSELGKLFNYHHSIFII